MIGYEIKSWEIRQIVRILRDLEFCDASTIRGLNAIRMGRILYKKLNAMQRIEQIRKEARNIQMALECMKNPNIEAMIERLDQLGVYYARSGELLSEVVGMRDAAVARLFHDEKETIISLSPSLATKLVNSSASELNALEKWLDRINASCKHQCDNLRTMISYEKERLKL